MKAGWTPIAEAHRHGFLAVVSYLERLTRGAARVGGVGPVGEEAIRFRHDPAMHFAAGDVADVKIKDVPRTPGDPLSEKRAIYEVITTFLGLSGTVTPLPSYFAEEVAHEDDEHPIRREFLDVFHHRALSLLYRLLVKFDFAREFAGGADMWSKRVLALAGIDAYDQLPGRALPVARLLRLSALLSSRARSSRGLEVMLEDVLGESLEGASILVEQFIGQWTDLDLPLQIRLGVENSVLGKNMVIGVRAYDRQGRFRVVVGPFKTDAYRRYLPEGDLLPVVKDVVSGFLEDPLSYELEVVVAAGAAPALSLSRNGTFRLGDNTWLGGRKHHETRIPVDVND